MRPLVSAIIPVHNGRAFVEDAVMSVFAQSHSAIECLVVDDGSTDGTPELVAALDAPVRYVRQPHRGVATARNTGAHSASAQYLAFLDADDLWEPEKVARQLALLRAGSSPMVMCSATVVDERLHPIGLNRMSAPGGSLLDMVLFAGASVVSCSSTALIDRAAFDRLGGFDEQLSMSADWDFLARVLLAYEQVEYVDQPLVRYRVHSGNMSRRVEALEQDMLRCFAKLFGDPRLPSEVAVRKAAAYAGLYKMLAASHLEAGHRRAAARNAVKSVGTHPGTASRFLMRRLSRSRRAGDR